jgi:hypothetical protein
LLVSSFSQKNIVSSSALEYTMQLGERILFRHIRFVKQKSRRCVNEEAAFTLVVS